MWHFRRLVLEDLGSDLLKELEFLNASAEANHKNYQIWWLLQFLIISIANCTFLKAFVDAENLLKFE